MGAPQYEQAGADIGGTGTTGTIPVWTGPSTLGDSLLSQSGTVVTNATGAIRANGTTQTTPAFMRHDATNSGIYFPATNEIGFTISGSHAMFISTGRNVGIGTTSPSNKLTVQGDIAVISGGVFLSTGIAYLQSGASGSNAIQFRPGGVASVYMGTASMDASLVSGYGLKLPATPGNADTQTLDCYQENTAWTPTLTGFGGTTPTVFASTCTRIGRMVICNIVLTATGGNTYSSTYSTTTISLPVSAAALCAATLAQGTNQVPNATVSGGNILVPTFALTTVATVITATYYV